MYRGGEQQLLAATLLSKGYAEMVPYSASRSSSHAELELAENEGRAAERGLWKGWEDREKARIAAEAEEESANAAKMNALSVTKEVSVSHIEDGGLLWVRYKTDSTENADSAKVAAITERVGAEAAGASPPAPLADPKRHDFCLAPFDDGQGDEYFRARVESIINEKAEVLFLDHGNTARVPLKKLLPCDAEVLAIPPLAHRCRLAFVRAPAVNEDYGNEAGNMLADLVWGVDCQAKVHWQDNDGTLVASLYAGKEDISAVSSKSAASAQTDEVVVYTVAEKMLRAGVVRVQKYAARDATNVESRAVLNNMERAQEHARANRIGMWQYGDVDSDDDVDGRRP